MACFAYGTPSPAHSMRSAISSTARSATAISTCDDPLQHVPGAYFGPKSGVGRFMKTLSARRLEREAPVRCGVIGLGAGILGEPTCDSCDEFVFYEINPDVLDIAERPVHLSVARACASGESRCADRRCAPHPRSAGAAEPRSARRRRVLERCDSGSPAHERGRRALRPASASRTACWRCTSPIAISTWSRSVCAPPSTSAARQRSSVRRVTTCRTRASGC